MKKVLLAYETALEAVRGMDFDKAMYYLSVRNLHAGICFYCNNNDIYFQEMETWIFKPPYDCTTTAEIIETLEYRINYLKENHENTF